MVMVLANSSALRSTILREGFEEGVPRKIDRLQAAGWKMLEDYPIDPAKYCHCWAWGVHAFFLFTALCTTGNTFLGHLACGFPDTNMLNTIPCRCCCNFSCYFCCCVLFLLVLQLWPFTKSTKLTPFIECIIPLK